MSQSYPHLFSPFRLRGLEIRNRILSTGHDTDLGRHGLPSEALIAYQRARAKGGVGLIIVQVVAVHETARYTSEVLMGTSDAHIAAFRPLFQAIRAEGTTAFVQLFHPGRELLARRDGIQQAAYAPSSAPTERFRIVPRALSTGEVEEIIEGYGQAARRMAEAGAQGVEIVASHGYLPTQFLNPLTNQREDRFGGSPENRLRFLEEVVAAVRRYAPPELILGLRLSGNEYEATGIEEGEMLGLCRRLKDSFDYFNVIGGTSASTSGAIHIVPPMSIANAYLAPFAGALKQAIGKPVFVAGRINQPQIAEQVLASGQADLCGMTRAMICDPEMPAKTQAGKLDDIRACIACNQACIGHFHLGYAISCIQHPETGRELDYGTVKPAGRRKRVLIAGGGPGGMKAAAIAAARGHEVTLYEAAPRLGGQALLAQQLPGRAEFGGIVTNLAREMELAGVKVVTNKAVDAALLAEVGPEVVILATGARPRRPAIEGAESAHMVDVWQLLRGEVNVGASVLVADWRCDWIGMGVAEKLARDGCRVRLAINGYVPGQRIQQYVRDQWNGTLHKLGVEVIPYARLYGADGETVYLQHTASGEPIICEGVDTVVLALGHEQEAGLFDSLTDWPGELHRIGDCVAPRTAEEAVLEGLKVASAI
jgi:2,4-dienoyl-CoA reductase-like NADH-dependent reductase (Old Yellow Enzyme family)